MNWFGLNKKSDNTAVPTASENIGDVFYTDNKAHSIFKSYIPEFLYKPPFGYPRKENLPLIRQLAKNPYIYAVIKTLCDEVASAGREVCYKKGIESTPELDELKKKIDKFFCNPNKNKESFNHLLRALTKDILEVDAGVWIKVFNKRKEFTQLFARDGASYLINPDIYGYLGDRADIVQPLNINYAVTPDDPNYAQTLKQYSLGFKDQAAYFQYGWTAAALPVPFGRREVIYMMQNPRSDSVYGLSPIQILADIIMTLVYGSNYNLDFYMNNNMPEGILTVLGANDGSIKALRERLDKSGRVQDANTGFWRKINFKIPITNQPVDFKSFQLDPKTMQIIEQQSWFSKLVWSCFGVSADMLGFTEDSNRATGQNQYTAYKRKAVRPLLEIIKYHIDMELIPEFGELAYESFEYKWDDYDIDEDKKKHDLYEQQIRMGVNTPEMIADELGIDFTKVKEYNDEKEAKEMERMDKENSFNNSNGNDSKPNFFNDKSKSVSEIEHEEKAFENELEEELVTQLKQSTKVLLNALDQDKPLDKIK